MTAPQRGCLYWARLDKRRPALVISPDARNALASDVLVIPCSTTLSMLSTHVRLRRGEAGLTSASVVKCEQITTIFKSELELVPLGPRLSAERIRQVEAGVMRAIGIPLPVT